MEKKVTIRKKGGKQSNSKVMNLWEGTSTLKRIGFNKPSAALENDETTFHRWILSAPGIVEPCETLGILVPIGIEHIRTHLLTNGI